MNDNRPLSQQQLKHICLPSFYQLGAGIVKQREHQINRAALLPARVPPEVSPLENILVCEQNELFHAVPRNDAAQARWTALAKRVLPRTVRTVHLLTRS